MKSVLETCTPRPDILRGTFNPEIFTASLGQVVAHYRGSGGTLDTIYVRGGLPRPDAAAGRDRAEGD